jgi:hypothetical protein
MKVPYTKSGKCGNKVYQRARYGQISYDYFIPKNPRTLAQLFVRNNFGIVAACWCLLAEEQRLAWRRRGKSKQTRRRLGKSWPLPGYNYYMAVNVVLANRGQPLLVLPPPEPWQPRPDLPLLSRTLSPQELKSLTVSLKTPPESPGRAPPPSG